MKLRNINIFFCVANNETCGCVCICFSFNVRGVILSYKVFWIYDIMINKYIPTYFLHNLFMY